VDLHLDWETFSNVDLKSAGLYRYAADPSTRITLWGYAFDDEPVEVVDLHHGEEIPQRVLDALRDPAVRKCAHNAQFERVLLGYTMGIWVPREQWRCTAVWGRSLALPGALGPLAKAIGCTHQKIEDRRLIPRLCTPKHGGIQKNIALWPMFKQYNRIDVEVEREIKHRLRKFQMPAREWKLYALDQKINDRGLPVNLAFAGIASETAKRNVDEVKRTLQRQTGLDNPNSVAQLLGWLQSYEPGIEDLTSATVDAYRKDDGVDAEVRSVLDLRKELATSSTKKLDTLLRAANDDGRMRGTFTFMGAARTGRWSGKLFQPQNLPRGCLKTDAEIEHARRLVYRSDLDSVRMLWPEASPVIASLVRSAIEAPEGRKIVCADLASIETVMLGWASGCRAITRVFEQGRDVYKEFAVRLFGVPYDQVTKAQRTLCKPVVLGAGYGMGARGLVRYAAAMGIHLTPDQAQTHIRVYRELYPEVVQWWYDLDGAAKYAVENRTSERVGNLTLRYMHPFLFIDLPSGRSLSYFRPFIGEGRFGEELKYLSGAEYNNKVWLSTFGGKLAENIIQAESRDVLAEGLLRADEDPDLELIGHVHDEGITLANADDRTALSRLITYMTSPLSWCDAPIRAAGWEGALYKKDW